MYWVKALPVCRAPWVELYSGTLPPYPIHGQVEECVNGMLQEVQAVHA
jgi:hypothetical protein